MLALLAGEGVRLLLATWRHRPRPPMDLWLAGANGPSFPSGHTTTSALVAALLCTALARRFGGRRRLALQLLCVAWAVAVGLTRVYLAVHWMTDVLVAGCLRAGSPCWPPPWCWHVVPLSACCRCDRGRTCRAAATRTGRAARSRHGGLPDQVPVAGAENVDDGVAAPRQPQLSAVRSDAAHLRGTPAGQVPGGPDAQGRGVQDGDRALVPVGDVDLRCVPAGVDPVSALARVQEPADPERRASTIQTPLRSMSATRKVRPSGARRTSCGIALTPGVMPRAGPDRRMAVIGSVAPAVLIAFRSTTDAIFRPLAGTTRSLPLNSQLTTNAERSG